MVQVASHPTRATDRRPGLMATKTLTTVTGLIRLRISASHSIRVRMSLRSHTAMEAIQVAIKEAIVTMAIAAIVTKVAQMQVAIKALRGESLGALIIQGIIMRVEVIKERIVSHTVEHHLLHRRAEDHHSTKEVSRQDKFAAMWIANFYTLVVDQR